MILSAGTRDLRRHQIVIFIGKRFSVLEYVTGNCHFHLIDKRFLAREYVIEDDVKTELEVESLSEIPLG